MGAENRNSYSKEFKMNAIKLVLEEGRKSSEVARDLGIHENLLYYWKKQYLNKQEDPFTGNGKMANRDEYVRKLEQEIKRLKEERDILKKAAIFFAKDP